jgi:modulator of FtsH protease
MQNNYVIIKERSNAISMNKVLRNTYLLLSLTLLFSGLTATWATLHNVHTPGPFLTVIGMFGLLFLTQSLRNSTWGLAAVFTFTGFMGYTLAPLLSLYLHNFTNGATLIVTALGGTGLIFLSLSAFVLVSRRDFSYMGGFLFAAIIVALLASIATIFIHIPLFQILVAGAFMLICSGLILFHTSQILNGGETNYIMATVSLYVALFNIFINLLAILGFFSKSRS